ncbi:asparagine synthase (glutamine-hydrolyzing) [Haladaptatus sp. DYSN1]|uniref:asparagine synthase (glutamine-hydrolyzing) n=1 Tax=unclassified Haladaptatus TaxID=2622732 RepID=UPI00240564C7|nr:asparagine synthase (glutamine-hydrolyzing) [Haladaptatus sp. DYSN1]
MCGIGGKLSFDTSPEDKLGELMASRMAHRGPDASGIYATGPALLAHRRLSILDLSEAGRQPMSNEDETVHIVFNGEIYNYRELKERVSDFSFTSETDTEILLHLYEKFGTECLQYLRGMFAFVVWDENKERLFLARDRLGQKPLFYRHSDDSFWFGSTIKAILADNEVEATPDLKAIRSYLNYQYVPHPKTGFEGINQLRPGEYAIVTEDGMKKAAYWSLSYENQFSSSPSIIAEQLRTKLREATKLRMRSDVPVGVFLSGGIDSSIVTALMADIADEPVQTYSIGFDEKEFNELEFAREVASAYDTEHHEYTVTPDSLEVLPEIVNHYEMPFGDPSALPTYYVSEVASQDITVVLGGDAGDENFAGYDRYTRDYLVSNLNRTPNLLRSAGVKALNQLPEPIRQQKLFHYARRALEIADEDGAKRYARFICHALDEHTDRVWNGPVPTDELTLFRQHLAESDGQTRLDRLMHLDIQTYLPDDLLVKVDRASMAHSLEVRSPFLDHELVEFAARIPSKYKFRRGEKKWILKRAFDDALPDSVINRKKQGFGVPINEWFRGELREFSSEKLERLGTRDPFDAHGLKEQFIEHQSGIDHGYRIWDLVLLEEWYEQFID